MPKAPPVHDPNASHPSKRHDPRSLTDARFYSMAKWRHLRRRFLKRNPLCTDPLGVHEQEGRTVPAQEVHHVIPRRERPDLEYTWSNLQQLCKSCHSKLTARERAR